MRQQRLPLVLSVTALLVAVFGATPLGQAAGRLVRAIPPFATKAGYANSAGFAKHAKLADLATNAKLVVGHRISAQPHAGDIPVVGADGKLPASIGAVGLQGPQGQGGPKGDKGDQGSPGLSGYQIVTNTSSATNTEFGGVIAQCPLGTKPIGGGASTSPNSAFGPFQTGSFSDQNGWTTQFAATGNISWTMTGWVVCAKVAS
jgi:hypothetical protein